MKYTAGSLLENNIIGKVHRSHDQSHDTCIIVASLQLTLHLINPSDLKPVQSEQSEQQETHVSYHVHYRAREKLLLLAL